MQFETRLDTVSNLLEKADEIRQRIERRNQLICELTAVNAELADLIGDDSDPEAQGRLCSLCGQHGHIVGRKKVSGKPTCKT
jgi:hypothetical protein